MNDFKIITKPFSASDIAIITSILDEDNIQYHVKNYDIQDLFGWGRVGIGYNLVTGPMSLVVKNDNYNQVSKIIEDYFNKSENSTTDSELEILSTYNKCLNLSILLGIFFPGTGVFHLIKTIKLKAEFKSLLHGKLKIFFSTIIFILGFMLVIAIVRNNL